MALFNDFNQASFWDQQTLCCSSFYPSAESSFWFHSAANKDGPTAACPKSFGRRTTCIFAMVLPVTPMEPLYDGSFTVEERGEKVFTVGSGHSRKRPEVEVISVEQLRPHLGAEEEALFQQIF